MPKPYTSISVIFNPESTGASEKLAGQFVKKLLVTLPLQKVDLLPTSHKGHAEKLAYTLALGSARPLIISSSGDGGYHEVINGLMKAQVEGAQPVAGLLPAGNANDHYRGLHSIDIVDAIVTQQEQYIDLLQLSTICQEKPLQRYAHSYIGLGLTPKAGQQLNRSKLKRLNEVWIVAKVLLNLSSITLKVNGELRHYDSLVFSNVPKMSKILKLSHNSTASDGKFEVTSFRRRNKLRLIVALLKATTHGPVTERHTSSYRFSTVTPTLVQLDGEIITIDANCASHVTIAPAVLRCII